MVHAVKTSLPFRTDQRLVCSSVSKLSCGAASDKLSKFRKGEKKKINVQITATGLKDDEITITQFSRKSVYLVPVSAFVVVS